MTCHLPKSLYDSYQNYYYNGDKSAAFWHYLLISALDNSSKPKYKEMIIDVIFPKLESDEKNWLLLKKNMTEYQLQSQLQGEILKEARKEAQML